MAIWQFYFYIIEKEKCMISQRENDIFCWKDLPSQEITFLEKKESWSESIIQYGEIDETCIEFFYNHEILEEILCRLDLRSITKKMLEEFLYYIVKIDGAIFYEGKVYAPQLEEIIILIKESRAFRFCKNPKKFLVELSETK